MKTLTLCGSMRFEGEMRAIAYELETKRGYNVLQCVYAPESAVLTREILQRLEKSHYKKIELSDGIYVVNIDGYIGSSVQKEIRYAEKLGKDVLYHCGIQSQKASQEDPA